MGFLAGFLAGKILCLQLFANPLLLGTNSLIVVITDMAKEMQFTALFEEEKEGGYTVTVPSVPGCVSYGKTIEVAKKNIQKALKLHLACVRAHSKSRKSDPSPKNIFAAILHMKAA